MRFLFQEGKAYLFFEACFGATTTDNETEPALLYTLIKESNSSSVTCFKEKPNG